MKLYNKRVSFLFFTLFINYSAIFTEIDERFISQEELSEIKEEIEKENDFSDEINSSETRSISNKKPWTVMMYIAADNDLNYYAFKNLKQMEMIGSNQNINIIVQLNIQGNHATKRYIIKKGKKEPVLENNTIKEKLNSGSYSTLVEFAKWSCHYFPAENYALILWNHGTGAIDPHFGRAINPANLFYLNPTENKFEIDRGISYLTLIYNEIYRSIQPNGKRGICFDDTFRSYISNHDLELALSKISSQALNNKKLALIGFDACLMSMIEVSSICKNYAEYFVGSQELEYGAGWKYDEVFEPFKDKALTPKSFARHIVVSYEKAYQKYINDYTLSAMDLQYHTLLEENVSQIAKALVKALENQEHRKVSDALRKCKSVQYCTCFDEPSYIDLGHFYKNLSEHIHHIVLQNKALEREIQARVKELTTAGLDILNKLIIENKVGPKLKKAQGISIYFPEHSIVSNYIKSPFANKNEWLQLLKKYTKN